MWGDFYLIKFYPKNWQTSFIRSMHPWLLHTTLWHYWLMFTFIIAINLFFIYSYKTLTYQRFDIRGTKSTGGKRRLAWPEMLVVILPFYWAINIVMNALSYLRVLEGSCGQILISVQVNGFQWGWKYCYSDTFYLKFLTQPIRVGFKSTTTFSDSFSYINRTDRWLIKNMQVRDWALFEYIGLGGKKKKLLTTILNEESTWKLRWSHNINIKNNSDLIVENYFSRYWLKKFNKIDNEFNNKTLNKKWQHGFWIVSQGLDPNILLKKEKIDNNLNITYEIVRDPLRLLRTSGALVLPTRSNIRFMSCSDDITHSWAVPGLGLKMDCVPGRLFCIYTNIAREGIYFGQCSELCGWNHYNMPIVLYAIPIEHFIIWWEIELNALFNKKIFDKNNNYRTYKLINLKYK